MDGIRGIMKRAKGAKRSSGPTVKVMGRVKSFDNGGNRIKVNYADEKIKR